MNDLIGLAFDFSTLVDHSILRKRRIQTPPLEIPKNLPEPVLKAARQGWEDRTRSEYIGVMVMRKFHGLLVDLNAPMDLQELALAMTLQEHQHAVLCMHAAKALGSPLELAFHLPELQQARDNRPLEAQLLETTLGTFVTGEVIAMRLIRHTIRVLPDTPFRSMLADIAHDEVLHSTIGHAIVKDLRDAAPKGWMPYPGDDWVVQTTRACIRTMRMRDVIDPVEAELFENQEYADLLMHLGIPPSHTFKDVYMSALIEDVPNALRKAGIEVPDDMLQHPAEHTP